MYDELDFLTFKQKKKNETSWHAVKSVNSSIMFLMKSSSIKI